ncbi:MAG: polyprenyl synthetase family protein [Microscillaceae bacterium]|nr:polyprenyl synthetase family protein [Microscillaceae bacterium]MDW8460492.1 polyprenyl synthetase family protein [Cytophagales bacterium]
MNNHLAYLQALLQSTIQELDFSAQPLELYEPINYIMRLGGKRMRPMLTLLGYQLFGEEVKKALQPALAVEIFHNFTLMHDDIMDKAPLRRNMPTVHHKWNESVAILSGDVMLVKAYETLLQVEDKYLRQVIQKFNQCAIEVCAGQQWDMNFETLPTVTEKQYIEMIRLKTAVLLGFALALGAILAGASQREVQELERLGNFIGIAFQLKDDLLDVYGDTTKFGKQVGGDIIANKKTFLLIKAIELAQKEQRATLNYWLNATQFDKQQKVRAIMQVYDELNIKKITEQKIESFFQQAFQVLDHINAPQERKNNLKEFIQFLIERES